MSCGSICAQHTIGFLQAVHGNLISQVIKLISSEDYGDVTRLPFAVREAAFIEACDCFASLFQDELARHKLMLCFASIWALTQQEVDNYKDLHKPQIKVDIVLASYRGNKPWRVSNVDFLLLIL